MSGNLIYAQVQLGDLDSAGTPDEIKFSTVENALFPTWRGATALENMRKKIEANLNGPDSQELEGLKKRLEAAQKTLEPKQKVFDSLKKDVDEKNEKLQQYYEEVRFTRVELDACHGGSGPCVDETEDHKQALARMTDQLRKVNFAKEDLEDARVDMLPEQTNVERINQEIDDFFLEWHDFNIPVDGVIGRNDDGFFLLQYIPRIIDILIKIIAPLFMGMMIYAGIRFLYAGDDEEELSKAKDFFLYAFIGIIFVLFSYSILKAVYFLLA